MNSVPSKGEALSGALLFRNEQSCLHLERNKLLGESPDNGVREKYKETAIEVLVHFLSMPRTQRESASRTNASLCFKVAASLISTVALLSIQVQTGYWTRSGRRPNRFDGQQTGSPGHGVRPCLPANESDCVQEQQTTNWAGVYVDSVTKEILHLQTDGSASLSPGASDDSRSVCLRWRAEEEGALSLFNCHNETFTWPRVGGDLWRDSMQAGKGVGFGAEVATDGDDNLGDGQARLVRDPFGFVFPGCAYLFSMHHWSPRNTVREVRVVINHDGGVTDARNGENIASWSFGGTDPVPGDPGIESWATGDVIVLAIDTFYRQSQGLAGAGDGEEYLEFALFTSDGGRTWLPVCGQSHASFDNLSEESISLHQEMCSFVTLALVSPAAVSLFPLTAAVLSLTTYLQETKPQGLLLEDQDAVAAGSNKRPPIYEVLEAHPFRFSSHAGGGRGTPQELEAVIVISKAIPRPTEGRADLACVINGVEHRAVWLSWSMVLCSVAHVRPEQVTLYISHQGSRFSLDASFVHTPPPRHTRLAWPKSEFFDVVSAKHTRKPSMAEISGIPSGTRVLPLDTSLVLCTMFKDEGPYLEEWLQYHRLLGISKVYMYDNDSSDTSRSLLKKYEASGFVHVRDWHHQGAQTEALNDCLCRFRHTARWMAFIDIDEFIDSEPDLPIQAAGNPSEELLGELDGDQIKFKFHSIVTRRKLLQQRLEEWGPKRHTQCMPWVNYCSYDQRVKSPGGITENYLQLEDMGERKIHMQKPLFKAIEALTLRSIGPHFLLYATEDIDLQYRRNLRCPYDWMDSRAFRIRHYRSKSLEEYVKRRLGGDSAYQARRYTEKQLTLEWLETNARCGKAGR